MQRLCLYNQFETARALGLPSYAFFCTANNSRHKTGIPLKRKQIPPGRDGVEWDSDNGYAEVGDDQVDQKQMIVSSQLQHGEGVQCAI